MKGNIFIRADGDSSIGMGHIVRTSALAKVLLEKEYKVRYISKLNETLKNFFTKNNFDYINLSNNESNFINSLLEKKDIILFDLFAANESYMAAIRKDVFKFLFDNLEDIDIPADLILHGSIYGGDYSNKAKKLGIDFIGGPEYVIMRDEFRRQEKRYINRDVKNILITMGGADPLHMTNKIIKDILMSGYNIVAVEGSAFSEKISRNFPNSVQIKNNPPSMSELMRNCDICISAGGTSTYELAATGTPTIVYRQADNQILQCQRFNSLGTLVDLGDGKKYNPVKLLDTINELSNDYEKRKQMSEVGQKLIDGKGVYRVVDAIEEYYSKWKDGLK